MALKIEIENNQGVKPAYWKISGYNYYNENGKCDIAISGYLNKEARISNKQPVTILHTISDIDLSSKTEMYAFAKQASFYINNKLEKLFDKAIDC